MNSVLEHSYKRTNIVKHLRGYMVSTTKDIKCKVDYTSL